MATPTPTIGGVPSTTTSTSKPSCTTAEPGQYGHVPIDACNSYYMFDPSFGGNLAFAVLFGLTLLAHIVQGWAYKKKFCWVVAMGASWEFIAFILRTLGTRDQQQMGYQIGGTLLFLLAPLWINAFAYMTVARLVYYILPDQKALGVKAVWLTKLFVWIDVACFLIQAAGGSMMSSNEPGSEGTIRIGQQVYMGGVGAQLGFIVLFCGLMGRFFVKMTQVNRPERNMKRAKILFWVLFAVLLLIIMRIIFRLVEFGPGANTENPILTNENYAFGLDAFPMILALVLLNVVHPGTVLRGADSEFPKLSRREKKQIKQQKKDEKRQRKMDKKGGVNGSFVNTEDTPRTLGQYEMNEMNETNGPAERREYV